MLFRSTSERPPLPPINLARRRANRELSTERVIALLQKEAPGFLDIAEVVGKWVWVQFKDKQPREVTVFSPSLVSTGTTSGRHGSTLAAHSPKAARATRARSIPLTSPPMHGPLDLEEL